ncbi:hypothetical protein SESBI_12613 [Sesbania bispinosa]|nr:hypothetical protein SESBI_12613 [Sesbania bispinosa]
MAEIPVSNENPLTMEQRMERLEGSFSQILDLLKTVIPAKEVVNDNSNNDGNGDGGPSNKTNGENSPKFVIVTESSGPDVKVREEEAKMMDKMGGSSQVGNSTPPQVKNVSFPNNPPTFQNPPYQPRKERVKIDPVPIPYSDLYDTLLQQHLVAPEVPQPVSNPPPKWYNPVEMCKYHMGVLGHSIKKCWTFKLRVKKLRDACQLFFKEGEGNFTGASVDNDPLLKH